MQEQTVYKQLEAVIAKRAQIEQLKAELFTETRAAFERAALDIHKVGPGITVLANSAAWNGWTQAEVVEIDHRYCWKPEVFSVRGVVDSPPVLRVRQKFPDGKLGGYVAVVFQNEWKHLPKPQDDSDPFYEEW